jgi:hypothetical protein
MNTSATAASEAPEQNETQPEIAPESDSGSPTARPDDKAPETQTGEQEASAPPQPKVEHLKTITWSHEFPNTIAVEFDNREAAEAFSRSLTVNWGPYAEHLNVAARKDDSEAMLKQFADMGLTFCPACDYVTQHCRCAAPPQPVPAEPPPGWKLVPIEPTPEMLRAAVKMREGPAVYKVMSDDGLRTLEAEAADDYSAMLAATPLVQPAPPIQGDQALSQGDVSGPCV